MPKSMYDIIKKQNGEHFAKAIRNYDNGIFDIPDIDKIVKYAGRDAEPIMNYLVSLKNIQIEEMSVHRDPIDLLAQAGYDAYVADTLEKQNAIKKYYAPGEELCTFRDPHRFEKYYIINAVRKDVDKIKRNPKPQREDEYGTSVISIQVLKSGGFISIKNRYNHTVDQPDNTLYSNPDNIILGLSDAIKHYFNVDFSATHPELPKGYTIQNNCICKYNQEIDNIYFGTDFYVKDGIVHELDKDKELMLGNGLILNLSTKEVKCLSDYYGLGYMEPSELVRSIENLVKNKKIHIEKAQDGKKSLFADGVHVLDVLDGMITYINAPNAQALRLCNTKLSGDLDFSNVNNLNLNGTDLSACNSVKFNPNASSVRIGNNAVLAGYLDFSNVENLTTGSELILDFSRVTGFKFPKNSRNNIIKISITNVNKTKGIFDFDNVRIVNIRNSDLSNIELAFGENCKVAEFDKVVGLHGAVHMQNIQTLFLLNSDLSHVSDLKINPSATDITIRNSSGLSGNLDFSNVQYLNLDKSDLANITNIKFGNCKSCVLVDCKNLRGNIDLSGVSSAIISGSDFSNVSSLKLPVNLNDSLQGITTPRGVFDVSNINSSNLYFSKADLSRTTDLRIPASLSHIKFHDAKMPENVLLPGKIETLECDRADFSGVKKFVLSGHIIKCDLTNAVGLHGDLDFSNVDKLDLTGADLSRVKNIKFNPNGEVRGLNIRYKTKFALINATQRIKQSFTKSDNSKELSDDSR